MRPTPRRSRRRSPRSTSTRRPATAAPPAEGSGFAAAVLCGGGSRRMGRDKALLVVEGRPMAARVADAARAAGATQVVAVGGQAAALEALDLPVVPDPHPGGGPLQAVAGSLEVLGPGTVLVLACDLVHPDPVAMAATVGALSAAPEAAVAVPVDDRGRRQWVHSAWRPTVAGTALAEAWRRGERSLHRAVAGLVVVDVRGIEGTCLADADRPEDLPGDG